MRSGFSERDTNTYPSCLRWLSLPRATSIPWCAPGGIRSTDPRKMAGVSEGGMLVVVDQSKPQRFSTSSASMAAALRSTESATGLTTITAEEKLESAASDKLLSDI